jgi:hypothetical protein
VSSTLGGLPPAAVRRVTAAQESSLWSSPLPVGDEAALRSVGFEPAGTVTASVPSWPFGYRYPQALVSAGARAAATGSQRGPYGTYLLTDDALTAKRAGGFTHDYIEGAYGGFMPDTGFSWQKVVRESRERQLVAAVLDRLRTECSALGGHGVVAIRLGWRRRPDLDFGELAVHDLNAVGLAVRARDADVKRDPFTAALTGTEACALLRSGLAPSHLAFGVGVVHALLGNRTRRHMRSLGQIEVPQFSEAVEKSLTIAIADLERNGDGDVIVGCQPQLSFERIVGSGLESQARIVGTAMRRFSVPEQPDVLTVLPLRDRTG